MKKLTLPRQFDMHVHFRNDATLKLVAPYTAQQFCRALVMPNTHPAIRTPDDIATYKRAILEATKKQPWFEPLMTFKIYPDTPTASIRELKKAGAIAGKVYPQGLTTNAEDGVRDFFALYPIFEAMQKENLVLCIHGEMPGDHLEGLDREAGFLQTLMFIAHTFPDLRIVMEHITTEAAVHAVLSLPSNVAATITVHHLMLTHDDVGGDRMRPHHYCKPVAKKRSDRDTLVQAAISGCPKFFFGSDSAPHAVGKKECAECCAGIFTAPVALQLLAQLFDEHNALDRLEHFTSKSAMKFYSLRPPHSEITLTRKQSAVPPRIGDIVPFCAGNTLQWSIQ